MGKKMVCGPDNVREFNAQLRDRLPAFHALAKQLHACGMISGLAGATLESGPFDDDATMAADTAAGQCQVCADCGHFTADRAGDGTGVGACAAGGWPGKLKWPGREACRKFRAAQ